MNLSPKHDSDAETLLYSLVIDIKQQYFRNQKNSHGCCEKCHLDMKPFPFIEQKKMGD